jgi:hypothetical protein
MSVQTLEKVSVIPQDDALPAVSTPMSMIDRAIAGGAPIEVIEKLMALQERWDANQSRKLFDEALANAQGEMPALTKNRLVNYASQKSPTGYVTYRHEDLAEVIETVKPVLKKFGLAHRFRTTQDGDKITVTCIITGHGHREENSLSAGRDTSGGKNNHQEIASAVTYLERYTLKAALGLAASHDDDAEKAAKPATKPAAPGSITQEQADNIYDLLEEKGASRGAFAGWLKQKEIAERIEDIPANAFATCVEAIKQFKKA